MMPEQAHEILHVVVVKTLCAHVILALNGCRPLFFHNRFSAADHLPVGPVLAHFRTAVHAAVHVDLLA